jgi:membrane fusion protein, multidrug efflux system
MKRATIVVVFIAIAAAGAYVAFGKRVPGIGTSVSGIAARFQGGGSPAPDAAAQRGAPAGAPGARTGARGPGGPGGGPGGRGPGGRPGGGFAVSVVAAVATARDVAILQRAVGWVEPVATVNIRPRIDGMIVSVAVKDGQMVKAGDLLFKLDDRTILAAIAKDEAQIARDQAMQAQAQADAVRARDLFARKVGTKMLADQTAANAKALGATIQADRAALETDRIQLGYTTIRAPISGRVGTVATSVGNYVRVADSGNTLVNIVQVAPVRVSFAVPERELDAFRAALARPDTAPVHVYVASDPKARANGRLNFIDNVVDNATGTFTAKAEIPNTDGALWPGQYVTVQVELGMRRGVTVVPLVAVQQGPNGAFVFRIKPNKTVEMRKVALAEAQGDQAVIAQGLVPGDHVVIEGQAALGNGTAVRETIEGEKPPTRLGEAEGRRRGRQGRVQ